MTAAPAHAGSSSTPSIRMAPCAVSAWIVVTSAAREWEPLHATRSIRTERRIDRCTPVLPGGLHDAEHGVTIHALQWQVHFMVAGVHRDRVSVRSNGEIFKLCELSIGEL